MALIDEDTSDICKELNGQIFKVSDAQAGVNLPPMHPFCRSSVGAHFEDIEGNKEIGELLDKLDEENIENGVDNSENGDIIESKGYIIEDNKDMDDNNGMLIVDLQYFANKNISKMSSSELERSISSWKTNIEIHKNKLENPKKYYPNWDNFDPRYQAGLRRHWQHEINTFENDINDANAELKKR